MGSGELTKALRECNGEKAALVKKYLSEGEAGLRERHLARESATDICTDYTLLIDGLLKSLFDATSHEIGLNDESALVAVGGYGRGELNIRSDIDLMLVYGGKLTPGLEDLTQKMLYVLWDTGLDMGFSIRSVKECISLGQDDLKTMTSLIDLRFLVGSEAVFNALESGIRKDLFNKKNSEKFIKDKLEENRQRQAKYGGSVYILEPNVKEGEGGLRDLHTARWIVKARNGAPVEPFSLNLLSEAEKNSLNASLEFLLWVRNELHFNARKKTDQLSFDQQERIAGILGFKNTEKRLAVEHFMQQYFLHASNINHFSNLMTSRSLNSGKKHFLGNIRKTRLDEHYTLSDGLIALEDKLAFENEPSVLLKAFEHLQNNEGAQLDQDTRDAILAYAGRVGDGFRSSPAVAQVFLRILGNRKLYRALHEMHKCKFLGSYIPEFYEISCRVQHDIYHVYTVDTHTLFAIRELERLRSEHKHEFHLLSTIFEELPNQHVLMLAVLLHDIGKAHGKGHAEKGALLAPEICARLGMTEDETNIIKFLIKNHLLLANTAQYRDLHDDKLIIDFARKVGNIERLNLLYLLTFADVRAVGPEVWNHWKGALFQELYFKALTVLDRGTFEIEEAGAKLALMSARVKTMLKEQRFNENSIDEFFTLLPQRYFLSNSAEHIASHFRIISSLEKKPFIMNVRQDGLREYTELVICTHDVHGLFSMIAGVMAANSVNILGAQINTTKNGIALDVLQVNSPYGGLIEDEAKLKKIETDLESVISGRIKVAMLVEKYKKPSILDSKAKPRVTPSVLVDNGVSDSCTVLDIHAQNRVGLLYDITSTLSRLGLYIDVAKISTKGDDAADIFYVKDIFGQKIYFKEKLDDIVDALYRALTPNPEAREAK